jgi:hypothetical protein
MKVAVRKTVIFAISNAIMSVMFILENISIVLTLLLILSSFRFGVVLSCGDYEAHILKYH